MTLQANNIYLGDNLDLLQKISPESISLVYIDPPFNSNRSYEKNMHHFEDKFDSMKNYIAWIRPRITEIYRILKLKGSFYLHCDKNAVYYLKVLCDEIFGESNFRTEIIWIRTTHPHSVANTFDTITDSILFYTRSPDYYFQPAFQRITDKERSTFPYIEKETGRHFKHASLETSMNSSNKNETRLIDGKLMTTKLGWKWTQDTFDKRQKANPHLIYWTKNGRARYKLYLDDFQGYRVTNLWTDIPPLDPNSKGAKYPTQKPIELLERIIQCSCPPEGIVLDSFCGSGSTLVAAKKLGRYFIGIDNSQVAVDLAKKRLHLNSC